jgi:hypothetical protein
MISLRRKKNGGKTSERGTPPEWTMAQNSTLTLANDRQLEDEERVIHRLSALAPIRVGVRIHRREVDEDVRPPQGVHQRRPLRLARISQVARQKDRVVVRQWSIRVDEVRMLFVSDLGRRNKVCVGA